MTVPMFSFDEWSNPRVVGIRKEEAHASFFAAESREIALNKDSRDHSGRYLSLNGKWQFLWAPSWAQRAPRRRPSRGR